MKKSTVLIELVVLVAVSLTLSMPLWAAESKIQKKLDAEKIEKQKVMILILTMVIILSYTSLLLLFIQNASATEDQESEQINYNNEEGCYPKINVKQIKTKHKNLILERLFILPP